MHTRSREVNGVEAFRRGATVKDAGAWYRYPEPAGRSYALAELHDAETVEQLFDYCQILLAVIHAAGWRELFRIHGASGLLEVNRRSGWFDDSEALDSLMYHARIAGYDPEMDQFGRYDEGTGVFLPGG